MALTQHEIDDLVAAASQAIQAIQDDQGLAVNVSAKVRFPHGFRPTFDIGAASGYSASSFDMNWRRFLRLHPVVRLLIGPSLCILQDHPSFRAKSFCNSNEDRHSHLVSSVLYICDVVRRDFRIRRDLFL